MGEIGKAFSCSACLVFCVLPETHPTLLKSIKLLYRAGVE